MQPPGQREWIAAGPESEADGQDPDEDEDADRREDLDDRGNGGDVFLDLEAIEDELADA